MKAGDVVKHRVTEETWTLACTDNGIAYPGGEPLISVEVSTLELLNSASVEEYLAMLRMWAYDHHSDDIRHRICKAQLEELSRYGT